MMQYFFVSVFQILANLITKKAKLKMLYYLNSDPEYYKKLKPATQEKYKFKKVNGRWV